MKLLVLLAMVFPCVVVANCNLSADDTDLARRNALLRLSTDPNYRLWVYDSADGSHKVAVVIEPKANPETVSSTELVLQELKDLDGTILPSQKLYPIGTHPIVDSGISSKGKTSEMVMMIAEGFVRIIPIGVFLASPWIFQKQGVDLVWSKEFLLLNGGIMFTSWWLFPELMTRVSAIDMQVYKEYGLISPALARRLNGGVFERFKRRRIYGQLLRALTDLKNQQTRVGVPVYAVVLPADLATSFGGKLTTVGYRPASQPGE